MGYVKWSHETLNHFAEVFKGVWFYRGKKAKIKDVLQ